MLTRAITIRTKLICFLEMFTVFKVMNENDGHKNHCCMKNTLIFLSAQDRVLSLKSHWPFLIYTSYTLIPNVIGTSTGRE